MKYIIERASTMMRGSIPCDGCVKEQLHEISWDSSIYENTTERWTKEVDDLIAFVDQYGKIVIGKTDILEIPYEITIYDDYIE